MQQAINLAIVRAFAAKGIEIAFPTRTLYIERSGPGQGPVSG
jgi:small-conductance mechanosensitive channel